MATMADIGIVHPCLTLHGLHRRQLLTQRLHGAVKHSKDAPSICMPLLAFAAGRSWAAIACGAAGRTPKKFNRQSASPNPYNQWNRYLALHPLSENTFELRG